MGLGPRRVVDNQGKVRSGSAYFPFTVPLRRHSTTQAWIAGAPLRPRENHLRRCRSAWDGYPPGRGLCTGTALRSGVREGAALWSISICSPLSNGVSIPLSRLALSPRAGTFRARKSTR
ncbi:hypothetical protein PA99_4739 [Pseudomonas aeruginosa PA99]|nr:hypothetical protein PA99_4739 [Pseudomonas aeruginosa PA99]